MVEGARLESVFRGNSNAGSNPALSASDLVDSVCRSVRIHWTIKVSVRQKVIQMVLAQAELLCLDWAA